MTWVCRIEARFGEPGILDSEIEHLMGELANAVVEVGAGTVTIYFDVEAADPVAAATEGLRLFAGAARRGAEVSRVEIITRHSARQAC